MGSGSSKGGSSSSGRMSQYRLTYFNVRGRAEAARYIFAAANVKFEDVRIQFSEWPALKSNSSKCPFGVLPTLELDNGKVVLSQHVAICRYLAASFGLQGSGPLEQAVAEQYVLGTVDMMEGTSPLFKAKMAGDEQALAAEYQAFKEKQLTTYLQRYSKFLRDNGNVWFVGRSFTWADLYIAECLSRIVDNYDANALDEYANLDTLVKRVHSIPGIEAYVQRRPRTN